MKKHPSIRIYRHTEFIITLFLFSIALVSCVTSALIVKHSNHQAGIFWILGLSFSFLFMAIVDRKSIRKMLYVTQVYSYELFSIILLLCFALFLRIFYWTSYPVYIHNDEASCGLYSRMINDGTREWFSIGWYGLPMIAYTLGGLGLRIFGDTIYGLRYINSIVGTIGILFAYLLAKEIYNQRVALTASLLLSVMYIHILFSNNGLQDIQGPTIITIALFFFVTLCNKPTHMKGFLSGVSLILSLVFYWGARVSIPIVVAVTLFALLSNKKHIYHLFPYVKSLFFGLVVTGLPVYSLYKSVPGSFNGHTEEVLITNTAPNMIAHLTATFGGTNYVLIVIKQLWITLLTFFTVGDNSLQIGYNYPFLEFTMSALLPVSLIVVFFSIKNNWKQVVLIWWIVLILAASALTSDAPWWPRLASLTPAVAIIIAFSIDFITSIYRPHTKKVIIMAFMCVIGFSNLKIALMDYPKFAYNSYAAPTVIASYIKNRDDDEYNILLANRFFTFDYETFPFLVPGKNTCTVNPEETVDNCLDKGKPDLVISMPGNEAKLEYIRNTYPRGNIHMIKDNSIAIYELLN